MAAHLSDSSSCKRHVVLTYLDIKGYAEPIRLALSIGQIPFDDRRVSYEEVKRMRSAGELPFGQVPVMDINGVRHGQSRALLRWAGARSGLYPMHQDAGGEILQLHIDAALDTITDIQSSLTPAWYGHACSRSPLTGDFYSATKLTEAQMTGVFEALNTEILPVRFQQLERMLESWTEKNQASSTSSRSRGTISTSVAEVVGEKRGGPYFCGKMLTIADVSVYVLISGMQDGTYLAGLEVAGILSACPRLLQLVSAVAIHPQVRAWEDTA